ncbi:MULTISPECIES: SCO family protein [Sutcliffiella]|uniref:SCO family protein n=1 Tax=Sutcliffiella TaxID=2837511 RepID=UPI0022DD4221|nr:MULTISPECIES: SCO family protein [Sutcliffiella]MED4016969.1 SCO family protein [Sutcliffiella cohnii]WBL16334.1 SCO family protein [Sutcliffiella sp. NC1]
MTKRMSLLFVLFFLTACGAGNSVNIDEYFPMKLEVKELEAINQDEQAFQMEDRKGDVWLANFIFTNCETVCPPMTANMSKVQQYLAENDVTTPIVSFSIDPEYDNPAALKEYGERVDADFSTWDFVTGYSQREIESFANISFMVPAYKIEGGNQYQHSTAIFLIDQQGFVRGEYSGIDVDFEKIKEDVEILKANGE